MAIISEKLYQQRISAKKASEKRWRVAGENAK